MITFDTANSWADLQGILDLQKLNLTSNLTHEEVTSQGFVTVNHTFDQLAGLNAIEKHIIAKDGDKVIGYLLAMTQASKSDIPVLVPMFEIFNDTQFNGKRIADYTYLVIGQVCIDKSYRGQGIFDKCYATYKEFYGPKYDFAITEIATSNMRSLNAHRRIGFKEIKTYTSPDHIEWAIVLWDWKN